MELENGQPVDQKLLALAIGLAILPVVFGGNTFLIRLANLFLVFSLFTIGLNLVFGHTDQLFLFVGGLAGIGAYTTAISADALGVTAWITVPFGALLAGILGLIVSYVAAIRRFSVIMIAILTLAIQLILHEFFIGARSLTGGSTGFRFSGLAIEFLETGLNIDATVVLYYLLALVLVAVLIGYQLLIDSKYGLAFDTIREDEIAAEAAGIDVVRYKVLAGFLSASLIGFVGVLYAQVELYVLPSMFAFASVDIMVLIMLVLGGMRTRYGPLVGTAIILYVNQQLGGLAQWRIAVFGLLLMALFLFFREGIVRAAADWLDRYQVGETGPLNRLREL